MAQQTFFKTVVDMNYQGILERINAGCNVNQTLGYGRLFEWLLPAKDDVAKQALDKVLTHPFWDPNYRTVDNLSPLERALLHKRTDVALKIITHPNAKPELTPRLLQLAKASSSRKIQNLLTKHLQNQR